MRVITGSARGRRLKALDGLDVRPTTDKVKESLFSALQFDLEGRRVLDLFAGSGQLGLEALSRGADSAVFVDKSKASIAVVRDNLSATRLAENARVMQTDALTFLKTTAQQFDVAFLDPPYGTGLLQQALAVLPSVMSEYGLIACEHPVDEAVPDAVGPFAVYRRYRFGKIAVTVYRKGE